MDDTDTGKDNEHHHSRNPRVHRSDLPQAAQRHGHGGGQHHHHDATLSTSPQAGRRFSMPVNSPAVVRRFMSSHGIHHQPDLLQGHGHHDAAIDAADVPGVLHSPALPHVLGTDSASVRRAANELIKGNRMRGRRLIVDTRVSGEINHLHHLHGSQRRLITTDDLDISHSHYADEHLEHQDSDLLREAVVGKRNSGYGAINKNGGEQIPLIPSLGVGGGIADKESTSDLVQTIIQQTSAVAVVALLNIMVAIPFGASYFPIGWKADGEAGPSTSDGTGEGDTEDEDDGQFPLSGKQALGIRMFLFATLMGQIAFTWASKFVNPIGLQMVENVPFLHALCHICIQEQGYGVETLSTVMFLFGFSSVIVGLTFYLLGKFELGKIVYFFPNHVLVGCIGGIGVFIVITAIEVTTNVAFQFNSQGIMDVVDHFDLLRVVLGFECTLRLLVWLTEDKNGVPKYPLLSPVFYCMITPLFYLGLWMFGISMDDATEGGYFFPPIGDANDNGGDASASVMFADPHLWDIFHIIDFSTISWIAVVKSTGTMIALAAFSLIHVPINIPAFAISTDVDTDMNAELIAHGYANALSGMFGGLQTYMTYSNSVLYAKSGGKGKISSLAIVVLTMVLFVIGPSIASYLPRCMAGTLLLHIGIDLVLEGVYDSYGNYDYFEYAGIWVITIVMTVWGMTAALIAGVIAALSTYAVQSINYQNPIRQVMTASTLRSSAWTRCARSREILEDDETGRSRILVFQLQGHLFFGNVAQLSDTIRAVLKEKKEMGESPIVVIVDFTLVVGMDSSAAHSVAKLKKIIHRLFHVEVSMFVTGSDRGGFPCEYALSEELAPPEATEYNDDDEDADIDWNDMIEVDAATTDDEERQSAASSRIARGSISVSPGTASMLATKALASAVITNRVCESLDEALKFAEDMLIARKDPDLGRDSSRMDFDESFRHSVNTTKNEEVYLARKYMRGLLPASEYTDEGIELLLSMMKREEHTEEQVVWEQGSDSDSAKLLISGELISIIEDTGASEVVRRGNIVGELGLVQGTKRLTALVCNSEKAILYSLNKDAWDKLLIENPQVATLIHDVVIRYLAHRVQHVNNRYFHTTLPV